MKSLPPSRKDALIFLELHWLSAFVKGSLKKSYFLNDTAIKEGGEGGGGKGRAIKEGREG